MLRCTTLAPESASISTIGGPGKEFWVFGKNYPMVDKKTKDVPSYIGHWRLEISPESAAMEDCFFDSGFGFVFPENISGKMLITDIAPGKWQIILPDGRKEVRNIDNSSGCILIENANPGNFCFRKISNEELSKNE